MPGFGILSSSYVVVFDRVLFGVPVLVLVFAADGRLAVALFHAFLFVVELTVLGQAHHLLRFSILANAADIRAPQTARKNARMLRYAHNDAGRKAALLNGAKILLSKSVWF